jgi:hypothetical protein
MTFVDNVQVTLQIKRNYLFLFIVTRKQYFECYRPSLHKITLFWDIPLCNPLKVNRRFGGTYLPNLLSL